MCIQARDGWIWTMIWMNMVFPQIRCKSKDPRKIGWYGYWPMVANSLRNSQAMSHLLEFNAGFCRGEYRDAAEPEGSFIRPAPSFRAFGWQPRQPLHPLSWSAKRDTMVCLVQISKQPFFCFKAGILLLI